MAVLFLILAVVFFFLWNKEKKVSKAQAEQAAAELATAQQRIETLSKYEAIIDVEAHCQTLKDDTARNIATLREKAVRDIAAMKESAQFEADGMRAEAKGARESARQARAKAEAEANQRLSRADEEAKRIVATAEEKAKAIAGSAYDAMNKAQEYKTLAATMKNVVEGYGD